MRASSPFHPCIYSLPLSLLPSPIAGAAYPVLSHPTHYWLRFGDNARAHAASCMDLDALGPAHHRRWRGECSNQSSAPALAAWALLQARVVPSLFAYLRPGCCSIAVASMNSCSGPFSLHIFPLFIRSFDLRRCAFPVISTSCFARLALPCPSCPPGQVLRAGNCLELHSLSFFLTPLLFFPNCLHLPTRGLFPGSHIARQNKRGVVEGQDTRKEPRR